MNILDIFTDKSDLLHLLHEDHQRLKALIKEAQETTAQTKRTKAFAEFRKLLIAHSKAEEKVLYRRLEKAADARPDALEGFVEHEVAENLMHRLQAARQKTAEKWTARCKVLKELLEHHIEEEESQMFRDAREQFDAETREKMGAEFNREKAKHGVVAPEPDDTDMAAE